jgi:hypothetical protein
MKIFSSTSYDSILLLLTEAVDWLQKLGISHGRTRLGEYERAIRLFINAHDRSAILHDDLPAINNAIYEAYELIDIFEALSGKYDKDIEKHLRLFATGPVYGSAERTDSSSNKARNVAFELAVMGLLVRARLTLDFTTLADATAKFENKTLLFECKRPQSLESVERRIKESLDQLKMRINGVQKVRHRGLVAIDITKAMNPDAQVFVTQTEQGINMSMDRQIDLFIARYEHCWARPRCSQSIGVLIRLRQMSIVEYEGYSKLFHCQQIAVHPFVNAGALNHRTLEAFTNSLAIA